MVVNFEHAVNNPSPTLVTEDGSLKEVKDEHPQKAPLPMLVTSSER